jgi:hypothetical protein
MENTFRLLKRTLDSTASQLRDPAAAHRWTWLVLVAHTQLPLTRPLARDLRRPWERPGRGGATHPGPSAPGVSKPPRDQRLASAWAQTRPTRPGRSPGSRNRHIATSHDMGLILVTGQAH